MQIFSLRQEYADGFASIQEALRQHTAFCLCNDFDQIRQTDKITVKCLNCGQDMKVAYANLATVMFCNDCTSTEVSDDILHKLVTRLESIRTKLLSFDTLH